MADTLVRAELQLDSRPYEQAASKAAKSTEGVEKALDDVRASSAKTAVAVAALGTAITVMGAKAVQGLKGAVMAASDLNDSMSRMQTTFGKSAIQIERWADNSARDFGMSTKAAYDAVTMMGQMGQAAGLTGQDLTKFSTSTVQLAADLNSFYKVTGGVEQVMHDLQLGMRGSYASLNKYNILVDDATLRNRAFEMGIVSTTDNALTPQQKVLAATAEIVDQAFRNGAIGDFAASADDLSVRLLIMQAALENSRAELGEQLIPIAILAAGVLTTLAETFNNLPEWAQKLSAYVAAALAGLFLLGPAVRLAIDMVELYKIKQLEAAAASQVMGTSAATAAKGGIAGLVAGLGRLVALATAVILPLSLGAQKLREFLEPKAGFGWDELKLTLEGMAKPAEWLGFGGDDAATADQASSLAQQYEDALNSLTDGMGGAMSAQDALSAAVLNGKGALESAADAAYGYMNAQLGLAGARDQLLGMEDRFRASILGPATTVSGGSGGGRAAASEAESKALQKTIDKIREKARVEQDAEIEAARRSAKRRAEARADAQARREVQKGVAGAIATDKAARRGEDIDGFNQGGSVGEKTGSLTKGEQAALDKKIDGIRARYKAATDAQVKGLRDAAKAQRDTNKAVAGSATVYADASNSLDDATEAGLRNRKSIRDGMAEIIAVAQAEEAAVLAATGDPEQAARAGYEALMVLRDGLVDSAERAGFTRDEVMGYLEEIKLADKDFQIVFKVFVDTSEIDKLNEKATKLQAKLNAVNKFKANPGLLDEPTKVPPTKKPTYGPPSNPYPRTPRFTFSTGGEIYGPGGPRSDSVPIWASRGEFVVRASQYAANRDLVKAINAGTGKVAGGMNIGAVNVTEATPSGVRRSVIDALAESAYRSGVIR